MRIALALVALLFFAAPARAQNAPATKPLLTFVDTVGVAAVAPDIYVTWIYALATPTSWPSAGILVAFDCKQQKVRRLAHVVYHLNADSSGVEGPIVEDTGTWVDVSVPETYNLVCDVGSHRPFNPPTVSAPEEKPLPPKLVMPVA